MKGLLAGFAFGLIFPAIALCFVDQVLLGIVFLGLSSVISWVSIDIKPEEE